MKAKQLLRIIVAEYALTPVTSSQKWLFRKSAKYKWFMFQLAKWFGYAVSGDARFKKLGLVEFTAGPSTLPFHHSETNLPSQLVQTAQAGRRRIQIYRRGGLGDVLLITPVLRAFKSKYPDASLTVTTFYPEILKGNPYIDDLIKSEIPKDGFDVTLPLQYEFSPDDHIVEAYAKIAGIEVTDRTPEIYCTESELARGLEILVAHNVDLNQPFSVFHCASGWPVRDWSLSRFEAVAKVLIEEGVQVVYVGAEASSVLQHGIDLRGKTTIRETMAIVSKCAVALVIDSSVMHLAVAMRKPTVSLFGCTDPEKRLPEWALKNALYSDVVCRGCHHRQRPVPALWAPDCPWDSLLCMESITTYSVLSEIRQLLQQREAPLVSIVIPHHKDFGMIHRCLDSIFRYGAKATFEVIVVDDHSTDDSFARLQSWRPQVTILRNDKNMGFSSSCNVGAKVAKGEYVVFLNDDTTVTPNWLDELLNLIQTDQKVGVVGPKLLYPQSGLIQHCGTVFNEDGMGEHLYRLLPADYVPANKVRIFKSLTGACFLIRKKDFIEVGGLDTIFRMGGEDTDLCLKMLEKQKYSVYCPASVVFHYEGHTRGRRDRADADDAFNRQILRDRWKEHLCEDISDYCLLGEIESHEKNTWRWLQDVPPDIVARYDSKIARRVGRYPFKCELGCGMSPQDGYIHIDLIADAPSIDIVHDISRPLPFLDNTVGEILANHVLEHLSWRILPTVVKDMHRVLVTEGLVYIRTPNLRFVMERYQSGKLTDEHPSDESKIRELYESISPGMWANLKLFSGQDYPSNFHYVCMDPDDLRQVFLRVGFSSVRLTRFGREFSPGEIQLVAAK